MSLINGPYNLGSLLPKAYETKTPLSDNQIRVKRIKAKQRKKTNKGKRK